MADLPTGTVTFLFTDIEGSTRLWAEHMDVMADAVARHDEIVRAVIEDNGGYVFATGGDAFASAFQSATDAVDAALRCQLTIAQEAWGAVALRVRMGLHTGAAEERDANYFGPIVNEAARLAAAGHGGQILLGQTTYEVVADRFGRGIDLVDLGEYEFKDLDQPLRVYQIVHPELSGEFPELRGQRELRHNLPARLSSFLERDADMQQLGILLGEHRLVTLTGAGGSGKTSLAVEVARGEVDAHSGGVWFVDLTTVDDGSRLPGVVASTLGVAEGEKQETIDRLSGRLRVEPTLLVLDNCEHVLDASASLVGELLRSTEALRVLATSREPLGVAGEHPHLVAVLPVPDESATSVDLIRDYPAVRLFVDRASVARAGFQLSDENAEAVGAICRRVDGLPLALELAAARMGILSAAELLERLDAQFSVLASGGRDRPERHQTLETTLDWSYELLDEPEQTLLDRLSVFLGGFSLESAEHICVGGAVSARSILDLIASLVDKSLVVVDRTGVGARFGLLETVRGYAEARLLKRGDTRETEQRHADYFLATAVDSFDQIWGEEEVEWLDRLDEEWANLRQALGWFWEHTETQKGLLMAGSLYRFSYRRYHDWETIEWLERFVDADLTPTPARARALLGLGTLKGGDHLLDEAIDLYRRFGPPSELQSTLINANVKAFQSGDWERARALVEEAVEIARDLGDPTKLSIALNNQAGIAMQIDKDPAQAISLDEESLSLARSSGSIQAIAFASLSLGSDLRLAGDLDAAEDALLEARRLEGTLGGKHSYRGDTELELAELALDRIEPERAFQYLREYDLLVRSVVTEDEGWIFRAVDGLHPWARLAAQTGHYESAVTLIAARSELCETWGRSIRPTDRAQADKILNDARRTLDSERVTRAQETGRHLSFLEAIDYAKETLGNVEEAHQSTPKYS